MEELASIEKWVHAELGEAPSFKGSYYYEEYRKLLGEGLAQLSCIVELGVAEGASLLTWSRLCPKAVCLGFDLNPAPLLHAAIERNGLAERVRVVRADHNDPAAIARELDRPVDLFVDDGSHLLETTRKCFLALFEKVRPGGWYVIEDWGAGYWESFGGPERGVHRFLYELVDMLGLFERVKPEAGECRLTDPRMWPIDEIRIRPALAFVRRGADSNRG